MILVDSSVLIDLFRGRRTAASNRLRQMEADAVPFGIPMICCQEVMQGARDTREWKLLRNNLETQRLVLPENAAEVHWEAARIFFDCRRKGITVRGSIDCFIAALALEQNAAVLHDDDDFERICTVRRIVALRE